MNIVKYLFMLSIVNSEYEDNNQILESTNFLLRALNKAFQEIKIHIILANHTNS